MAFFSAPTAQLRVLHCLVLRELERMWKEATLLRTGICSEKLRTPLEKLRLA